MAPITSKVSARRAVLFGATGLVAASAFSVWTRGAILPSIRNAALRGEHLVAGGVPYLDVVRVLPARGWVTGVAWSPDGSRIAAISDYGQAIAVWGASGTKLADFERHQQYVGNSIAFLSNDVVLTAATHRNREEGELAFTLWDVRTGSIARNVNGPEPGKQIGYNEANKFAVSLDRRFAAAATVAGDTVRIYSIPDWQQVGSIPISVPGAYDSAHGLAFSPDGSLLAVALNAGAKIFDLHHLDAPPAEIVVYPLPRSQFVYAVAFSPDGRFLATGSDNSLSNHAVNFGTAESEPVDAAEAHAPIKIWNVIDTKPATVYPGHLAPVQQVSWSATGRFLAAAVGLYQVQLFPSLKTGSAIAASQLYASVMSVSCSPVGPFVAAATDKSVTIFALPSI